MYNMEQISTMSREGLISSLNDAENCLIQIQQVLSKQNDFKLQKTKLLNECESLQKKIKGLPFKPGIIASVILAAFFKSFLVVMIAVIVAAILYRKKQRPILENQIAAIQSQQIPAVEMQINQCDDSLKELAPWAMNVKSLLALLPDNLRNIEAIRGIREQLLRGARDWYTAMQGYESVLARQEQQRQMREMQANVQQVAASSERTAAVVEDVRKQTENIAKNTARTAAAAESTAYNSAIAAAAAKNSAKSNARSAKAAERTAAAAEDAAYWIRNYL